MSSASKSAQSASDLGRAERLKRKLSEFVLRGPLKDTFQLQQKLYFELADPADEHEAENMLDWFLFDWFDEYGETVIGHYLALHPRINSADRNMLRSWEDSINSVFQITTIGKNTLRLKDLESEDTFQVITSVALDQTPFKRGQYLAARLLPLGDQFIFSGLQFIMADRQSAIEALQVRQALEELDSPEALEKARQEQCTAFCEYFGCDEISIPTPELNLKLKEFQNYIFNNRRDPKTGMTAAEMFQERFGRELKMVEMPPPPESILAVDEVTILCDEFDGLVLLPDYKRFKRVFEVSNPDRQVPGWRDLVWEYIKNPEIPIIAFARIAERRPKRVENVLRRVLDKKDFSIEHLYAVLLHYKEPVEGLDDLRDDQDLWDAFDGNGKLEKAPKKSRSKPSGKTKPSPASRAKKAAAKSGSKAARQPARKTARAKAGKRAS
ncbi:MAG TPA: hypothetical protein VNO14_19865 [Blastocatellia bacterium]|nr:hypothetical protein [Blastocatellia bacterium]